MKEWFRSYGYQSYMDAEHFWARLWRKRCKAKSEREGTSGHVGCSKCYLSFILFYFYFYVFLLYRVIEFHAEFYFYFYFSVLAETRLGQMCETEHMQGRLRELLLSLIRGENLTQYVLFVRGRAVLDLMKKILLKVERTRDRKVEASFHKGTLRKPKKGMCFYLW